MEDPANEISDFDTVEIGNATLRLCTGIAFQIMGPIASEWVQVENRNRTEFFRVGFLEYSFLSLIDGKRSLTEIYSSICSSLPDCQLDETQLAGMALWAIETGIAETTNVSPKLRNPRQKPERKVCYFNNINPISFRITLYSPDRIVAKALPLARCLLSPLGASLWVMCVIAGACLLLYHFEAIFQKRISTFSSLDLVWMGMAWVLLKIFHELAHAITCRYFNCKVGHSGLLFILFLPIPYVDVTSIWREENKWNRMLVSASGIMAELWIASVCAMLWIFADPGPIRFHLENLILAAGINTLLVNANPLMKFDGYYLLSDWLEIPNLYQKGRAFVQNMAARICLGSPFPPERTGSRRLMIIRIYGTLSWIWSNILSFSLILAAFSLSDGIGLVLAATGIALWYAKPFISWTHSLFLNSHHERVSFLNLMGTAIVGATAAFCLFYFIPGPTAIHAPVVLTAGEQTPLHSPIDGFVAEVYVTSGSTVQQGQLLLRLESVDLEMLRDRIESKISQSQLKRKRLLSAERLMELKIEDESLQTLFLQKSDINEKLSSMSVRSPHSGTVLTNDIASLLGRHFRQGAKLLEIGDMASMKGIALFKQHDRQWIETHASRKGSLRLAGNTSTSFMCNIDSIYPRTSDYLPHVAFASNFGGALATMNRSQMEAEPEGDRFAPSGNVVLQAVDGAIIGSEALAMRELKLSEPYLRVDLKIAAHTSDGSQLFPGQTGIVSFQGRKMSLGNYWVSFAYRALQDQLHVNHGL